MKPVERGTRTASPARTTFRSTTSAVVSAA